MSAIAIESARVPSFPIDAIPSLVAGLRETFDSGKTRSLAGRKTQLEALIRFAQENDEALIEALRADMGKPELEARVADVGQISIEAKFALKNLKKWTRPESAGSIPLMGKSFVVRDQLGVVLILSLIHICRSRRRLRCRSRWSPLH